MPIINQISTDLVTALKAKEAAATAALRFIKSALANAAIESHVPVEELTDEAVIKILQSLDKKFRDSIEAYKTGGREDLVAEEEAQRLVLKKYLPASLTETEIRSIIQAVLTTEFASVKPDFGSVMKAVTKQIAGRADGRAVSEMVKSILTTS